MIHRRLYSIPRFGLPYTAADFAAGLRALAHDAPPPDAFRLLGGSPKFWTRSGRQALRLLLGALELKPGSGVALPLFTDPSLVSAIIAAGHRPVFIDIDERTLTMDPASLEAANDSFSAVVAVHLFGQPAQMPRLLEIARSAPVIEDAAHAPLSYLDGQMAGRFGPAAFYSFASTKYWPAGGGGLAIVHNRDLACKMAALVQKLSAPSMMQEFGSLLLQQAKSAVFSRRLYGILGRPMRRWAEEWALLEPHLDQKSIQRPHATVACRQTLRFPQRVQRQRANSLRLLSHLTNLEDVGLPRERLGSEYNYHMFPVLLRDRREREAVAASMWKRFVDTSTIYCGVVDECWELGYRGGCPVAESVARRLLTLPNHAALDGSDIDRVAEVFLSSLEAYRNGGPSYPVLSFGIRSAAGKRDTPAPVPSHFRSLAEPPQ